MTDVELRDPAFTERYRAIAARDSRFDGQFYTAVRTTGIYCRPFHSRPFLIFEADGSGFLSRLSVRHLAEKEFL